MYNFKEWVNIRENMENEIVNLAQSNPKFNINKIAKIMRQSGYNISSTLVNYVLKQWKEKGKPNVLSSPAFPNSSAYLKRIVLDAFKKNPHFTVKELSDFLKTQFIYLEPWQIGVVLNKYSLKPYTKPVVPDEDVPSYVYKPEKPAYTFGRPSGVPASKTRTYAPKEDEPVFYGPPPENYGTFNYGTGGGRRVFRTSRIG